MNLKTQITEIHYNKDADGMLFSILKFASVFYGIGSGLKNFLYDKHILTPKKVGAFVLSVGNLTTGGVGKTPVVAEIAKYFIKKGETVAIISRGYGGELSNKNVNVISDGKKIYANARLAGDEPYWLAENTKSVVLTCKNRVKAAEYAIKEFGVSRIILDDGFQHRKIHRDLDIVLVDSEKRFGNECLLPAGPLREGQEAFNRIDKLVVVSKNTNHARAEKLAAIWAKKLQIPLTVCRTEPDYVYNISNGEILPGGEKAVAMCAIGQPEQFFKFLDKYEITDKIVFDDHHQYKKSDVAEISGPVITTEKDAVKLAALGLDNIYALKLKTNLDVDFLLN